ncbi:prephenate dehydratase domain-containing protein [Staphylococcus aureus]|nr:prephenate dehydratase domain-containing protein [Staphylococcus aureus]WRM83860.1 prephenate dehydratase domain-containing protein [Staphylococcus aureus]WRM93508.1 prephenate dehydratase domain-containing protein [Staphylococcus aureus]WRN00295.1 prephenate dehydratase domain-containing protein [Staphylococcus aureus]WRN18117.1 prephenate dehydratase domain-containing protein [Staphylococcus aureus]
MQLYYLGPKGTFSYLACRQYFSENEATFQPKSNLFEVIKAVADDDTSIGVVPIENSIEGTINIAADALAQQDVFAHGEIRLDINFALYGNGTDSISDIKKCILLHQQSVKQQITYININLTMIMSTVQFKV